MSETTESEIMATAPPRRRRRALRAGVAGVALVAVALGGAWFSREHIASNVIEGTLAGYDLPATYRIVSIGPSRQIIEDVVVGDPNHPDLTVERAEVTLGYGFGLPTIAAVKLVRPRLYGRMSGGKVSFGSLDSVIYPEKSTEPFRLPDMRLAIDDGRMLVRSEYGDIGAKLAGAGELRGGFAGVFGAVAPSLGDGDCTASNARIFGKISIADEKPHFEGPLRLDGVACEARDLALGPALLGIEATASQSLDSVEAQAAVQSGRVSAAGQRFGSLAGDVSLAIDAKGLTSDIDLTGADAEFGGAWLTRVGLEGTVRARESFGNIAFEGSFSGRGLRPGAGMNAQLAGYQAATDGTLLAPLIARTRQALAREGSRSTLGGDVQARIAGGRTTLIIPQAQWQGTSGETLLTISRGQYSTARDGGPRFAGHFQTGGQGMPRLSGRMEQAQGSLSRMSLSLAPYRADDASIAIPALEIRQDASGIVRLNGRIAASGAIPGGQVTNLDLPITGDWREGKGLALWPGCVTPKFDRLELTSLTLQNQSLMLCAPNGSAIMRSGRAGTRFAAGVPSLDLAGTLGDTPAVIKGGPVGIAAPGTLVANDLDITLGPDETATRFRLKELTAAIGGALQGSFRDSEFRLANVPLDVTRASGDWAWRDDGLTITNGAVRVTDRQRDARFQPMIARDATLRFADNRIVSDATLREETTDRPIVDVAIAHDLGSGTGHADLDVNALTFDNKLQPDTVSRLALGTIANAEGTVAGKGRIDWDEAGVSSTGSFHSDSLDFAAAFGPVKGLAGTVEFIDLLDLVTAPNQKLTIRDINPGVVVENGVVDFQIEPNLALQLNSGTWPFMGGTLRMEPARMNLGVAEVRHYVFTIEGLDAAQFLERMELANLTATGVFDGTVPLVFDENGGRIDGGMLTARAPGGNVAYVGALTYEDISPIANFAFDALKSLDYQAMTIGMDGSLEGEIVTRVKIDGVKQGEGAKRNLITRRLANLPIRFQVNLRAPFMQLLSSFKSMYDPASVRDPRELGLVDDNGRALVPSGRAPVANPTPDSPDSDIQPSESEKMR